MGKLSIRKTSVMSTSSAASSPGYGDKKNFSSIEDMFKSEFNGTYLALTFLSSSISVVINC